jgi:uncharacterized protein YfaS (alpha-2-macroglobulin family)
VKYDRTELGQNDIASAMVTVHNNLKQNAENIILDLGIPPGFEVLPEDLQAMLAGEEKTPGKVMKYAVTAKQIILYLNRLNVDQTITLKYRLRAKYPIKASSFSSRVYEYYNPQVGVTSRPIEIKVVEKKKK